MPVVIGDKLLARLLAPATIDQAAPVQNTWYTILETIANVTVYSAAIRVRGVGETLEIEIVHDGITDTDSIAVAADVWSYAAYSRITGVLTLGASSTNVITDAKMPTRSVRVRARKTTAAGAGNLEGVVIHTQF